LGANGMGQLGLGHCEDVNEAQKVKLPVEFCGSPISMVCGGNHTLLMDSCNQVFVCGSNSKGRLFLREETKQVEEFVRTQVEGVVEIGAGFEHSCYITRDEIFSRGSNNFGQLGILEPSSCSQMTLGEELMVVSCGPRTTCALTKSGQVWTWGKGLLPTRIEVPAAVQVKQGFHHTCILTNDGRVFTHGKNNYGQRGTNSLLAVTQVLGIEGRVVDIQVGWYHCLALTDSGHVWGWGRNDHGQLTGHSINDSTRLPLPYKLAIPGIVTQIACGAEHSVAMTDTPAVYAWGWNEHGNCGQSSMSVPLHLAGEPSQIAAGYGFTLIWCRF
ncbi:hypothetical protein L0F63_006079, partial [Massospora cicadina]